MFKIILLLVIVAMINCIHLKGKEQIEADIILQENTIPLYNPKASAIHTDRNISLNTYHTITIHNQEEFDRISSLLDHNHSQGIKNIRVILDSGVYEYTDNHITLVSLDNSYNVFLDGNGSELVSKATSLKEAKDPSYIYSESNRPIEQWSETFQAEEAILPTDTEKIYKLKLVPEANVEIGDLIKVSQWYVSSIYKICKVDEDYMYFSTEYPYSLNRYNWDKTWTMNEDVRYGHSMPRFRVFRPSVDDSLREHRASCFIDIKDANINSLTISNLNVWGSAYDKKKGVVNLSNTSSKSIVIDNCRFSDCKSPCISIRGVDNVLIKECEFTDNYNTCIETDDRCINTSVVNNYFKGNGRDWYNYFDIIISGENFLVADNTLVNFTYGAIRVGNWWGSPKKGSVTGIVENNLIFYTPDFHANYQKHTLMDSGAIYVNTINDDVHIRYNRIFNIAGMRNYRGIFGDDGTCNSMIYGNIITGIKDSHCIDLRYVPSIENKEKYTFGQVNVGNVLLYNLVDGDIRFEGRKGNNECVKGVNFLLESNERKSPKLQIRNILNPESDTIVHLSRITDEFIVLSPLSYNLLKKYPIYQHINNWIQEDNESKKK